MAIKIPKPSNKTKTHTKSDNKHGDICECNQYQQASLVPFIDKISIVWEPANDTHALLIHSNIWGQTKDADDFKPSFTSASKAGGFNRAWQMKLPGIEAQPLLQYKYADSRAERFRLDFNPAKLGEHGMIGVHAALQSILPDGWPYVLLHGRITRIDVAVDLPGTRMDELLFMVPQGMWSKAWGVKGHLQTLNIGKPAGNYTQIYDKKAEQLAKGKAWPGSATVRVERRLRNPKAKKLTDLPTMENPFAMLVMTDNMPPPPPGEKQREWIRFADSVKSRGVTAALALLSKEKRAQYRKHLESHPHAIWDPHSIWSNWPQAIKLFFQQWV